MQLLDKFSPDEDWICDDCEIVLEFIGVKEVNQSNWDVHDGTIASLYRCPACECDFLIDDEGNSVIPESY